MVDNLVRRQHMYEACGWCGAILVLYAYFMVSTDKVSGNSAWFQAINILGAALLIIYTYGCHAYASMLVNIIWVIIGMRTVLKHSGFQLSRAKIISAAVLLIAVIGLRSEQPPQSTKTKVSEGEFTKTI